MELTKTKNINSDNPVFTGYLPRKENTFDEIRDLINVVTDGLVPSTNDIFQRGMPRKENTFDKIRRLINVLSCSLILLVKTIFNGVYCLMLSK